MPRTSTRQGEAQYHSADFSDPDEQVLDFMTPVGRSIQIPGREFAYDETGRSLEMEAFMREPVVIQIAEGDENSPPLTFVGDNGHEAWLPRGHAVRVPRYFVERLAASHETHFRQSDQRDPNVMDAKVTTKKRRQAYPFTVVHDGNPKGREWLARVTREGT